MNARSGGKKGKKKLERESEKTYFPSDGNEWALYSSRWRNMIIESTRAGLVVKLRKLANNELVVLWRLPGDDALFPVK